jgi:hypothetical protein
MKNNNDIEWILIEDKLKKEWNKQDAYNKKEEGEDNKIINFKEAAKRIQKL